MSVFIGEVARRITEKEIMEKSMMWKKHRSGKMQMTLFSINYNTFLPQEEMSKLCAAMNILHRKIRSQFNVPDKEYFGLSAYVEKRKNKYFVSIGIKKDLIFDSGEDYERIDNAERAEINKYDNVLNIKNKPILSERVFIEFMFTIGSCDNSMYHRQVMTYFRELPLSELVDWAEKQQEQK